MNDQTPVAVVTGSASGLGRAIAQRFIEGGYSVAGLDIQQGTVLDNLTEIETDITDAEKVREAFTAVRELGPLDVLVNAAGVYPRSTLADASEALYRQIFDVNVLGTVLVTQQFAASRSAKRRGCVINIASVDGFAPLDMSVLYSASKAAVINFTAGISAELAEQNIRIHGVAPAYIATDRVIELVGEIPDGAALPKQVAATCWSLTRPDAVPLVTGQTIVARKGALDID